MLLSNGTNVAVRGYEYCWRGFIMMVGPFRPLANDFLGPYQPTPFPLIPVLVSGIQPTRVRAAERLLLAQGLGLAGSL